MRAVLKKILTIAGFDADLYLVHVLRSARACYLLKCGLSIETVKKLGR